MRCGRGDWRTPSPYFGCGGELRLPVQASYVREWVGELCAPSALVQLWASSADGKLPLVCTSRCADGGARSRCSGASQRPYERGANEPLRRTGDAKCIRRCTTSAPTRQRAARRKVFLHGYSSTHGAARSAPSRGCMQSSLPPSAPLGSPYEAGALRLLHRSSNFKSTCPRVSRVCLRWVGEGLKGPGTPRRAREPSHGGVGSPPRLSRSTRVTRRSSVGSDQPHPLAS